MTPFTIHPRLFHLPIALLLGGALLAACSGTDDEVVPTPPEPQAEGTTPAIGFSSYVVASQTRSGDTGLLTDTRLQASGKGFGVFAYYTDEGNYASATIPNFMYNQHVTYNAASTNVTKWEYQPLKYWPNDFSTGAVDDQSSPATGSHNGGRLSFFAYAPYVETIDDTSHGIIALSANSDAGDPRVTYKVGQTPDQCVDLLWGVVNSGLTPTTISATPLNEGFPWLNVTKQTTTGRVDFLFRHALAQLNFFTYLEIDNILDYYGWEKDAGGEALNAWRETTKVTIENVTIKAADGSRLYETARLNLNNDFVHKPRWEDPTGNTTLTLDNPHVNEKLRDPSPSTASDITTQLMADIVGKETGSTLTEEQKTTCANITGVTAMADLSGTTFVTPADAHPLNTLPLMMIPAATTPATYQITITYYVTTRDPKLQGSDTPGYSRVKNNISKTFQLTDDKGNPADFQPNYRYYLGLGLGLTTVKFSVYGTTWADADTPVVPLPVNVISEHGTSADHALAPRRR